MTPYIDNIVDTIKFRYLDLIDLINQLQNIIGEEMEVKIDKPTDFDIVFTIENVAELNVLLLLFNMPVSYVQEYSGTTIDSEYIKSIAKPIQVLLKNEIAKHIIENPE